MNAAGSNALQAFAFEADTVRAVELDGRAWFVGRDVAVALGYRDTVNALKQHCRGVVKRHPIIDALGRSQEVTLIGEGDVLRLVVRSKLPAAERFERWVFDEVLPQIGRTGRYGGGDALAVLNDPSALRSLPLGYAERVQGLEAQVVAQAPKVEALDRIATARGAVCLTDAAKALQLRRCDLINWMQEHAWIHKREGTSWKAYQPRIAQGVLVHKVVTRDGAAGERLYDQVLVTPKGLARLAELTGQGREAMRA